MDNSKSIAPDNLIKSLEYLYRETFEGSPPEGSIYLDRGCGVFSSIENLSAQAASKEIAGNTIAAHTEHLRYYLEVLSNFLQGKVQGADWNKSWSKKSVSDDEWEKLKADLRKTYEMVGRVFPNVKEWGEDQITEAYAIVVHTAYHLGAIRQIAKSLKNV